MAQAPRAGGSHAHAHHPPQRRHVPGGRPARRRRQGVPGRGRGWRRHRRRVGARARRHLVDPQRRPGHVPLRRHRAPGRGQSGRRVVFLRRGGAARNARVFRKVSKQEPPRYEEHEGYEGYEARSALRRRAPRVTHETAQGRGQTAWFHGDAALRSVRGLRALVLAVRQAQNRRRPPGARVRARRVLAADARVRQPARPRAPAAPRRVPRDGRARARARALPGVGRGERRRAVGRRGRGRRKRRRVSRIRKRDARRVFVLRFVLRRRRRTGGPLRE